MKITIECTAAEAAAALMALEKPRSRDAQKAGRMAEAMGALRQNTEPHEMYIHTTKVDGGVFDAAKLARKTEDGL